MFVVHTANKFARVEYMYCILEIIQGTKFVKNWFLRSKIAADGYRLYIR